MFALHLGEQTDFDEEQSQCVADKVFDRLGETHIAELYTRGLEPLRFSFEGSLYVEIVIACTLKE